MNEVIVMTMESNRELLSRFLNYSVADSAEIQKLFASLPGAVTGSGRQALEQYVYVPGTKKHPLVLVAHTDTVWDSFYGRPTQTTAICEDGVFRSTNPDCGIGADDRAGCAMLWALRNCGHSLLIVSGEEKGKIGANYLRKHNPRLFRHLNRHQFMIELDWCGTGGCLYNQVDNTQAFKDYIAAQLGFRDDQQKGGCDLQVLCQKVCGVNIGVGYHGNHSPAETLNVAEWEHTYQALSSFLQLEHPKFSIPLSKQLKVAVRKGKRWLGQLLRKLKLRT